jgi:hypothetical protein
MSPINRDELRVFGPLFLAVTAASDKLSKKGSSKKGSSLLLTHKLNPVTRFICPGRFEYNIQTHGIT